MESKTYVFGENGTSNNGLLGLLAPMMRNNGLDPNLLLAMNRNGNGFGGEGGWFIWVIFLFFLMGWGNNGFGGFGRNNGSGLANEINNDYGRGLLLQAINGNGNAINTLASTLNCSVGQIQQAINGVMTQVQNVGNQVGQSSLQVINALQQGNMSIASQMADCCCRTNQAINTQGYESKLAICNQTNTLVDAGKQNTQAIMGKLDQMYNQTLLDKIDKLREDKSTLKAQIDNSQQTAAIQAYQAQAIAPVNATLADLSNRLSKIECALPNTVSVPYPQLAVYNPEVARAAAYGAYQADAVYGRSSC